MFNTQGQEVSTHLKSFQPGVVHARIHTGYLRTTLKGDKKCLELVLEGEPLDNFEGWPMDRDNPEGPKFPGQTAKVLATVWTEQYNENNLSRNEIMSKLTVIAQELGLRSQLNAISALTIEEWVLKAIDLVRGRFAWWFLKGQEEEYNGKTIVKLILPKYKFMSGDPLQLEKFDKNNRFHFRPLESRTVSSFAASGNDFELD